MVSSEHGRLLLEESQYTRLGKCKVFEDLRALRSCSSQVLELLRGLVKVSSYVSRNYSTSYLSEMRVVGGGGGFANYDDLSILSAQFHAAVSWS